MRHGDRNVDMFILPTLKQLAHGIMRLDDDDVDNNGSNHYRNLQHLFFREKKQPHSLSENEISRLRGVFCN